MGTVIGDFTGQTLSYFGDRFGARASSPILALAMVVGLAGCAIHPIQQDVTHMRTAMVVDRIRCETRRAIQDKAIALLRSLSSDPDSPSTRLANDLEDHRRRFLNFSPFELRSKGERDFYYRYINTAIAIEFSFDFTESGGGGFAADPVRLISGGTAGVAVVGSDAVARNNIRRFTIADTFGELLHDGKLDQGKCIDGYAPDNFQYPIAGSVGMKELVDTFIDLNEDKVLSPSSKDSPEVFGDTLKFTTTLSGSVTPHVVLAPVGNRWGVDPPTNIGLSAGRVDNHQLTIGLSIGAPPVHAAGTPGAKTAFLARSTLLARPTLRQTGNANKDRALQAIENQHEKNFFDRAVLR